VFSLQSWYSIHKCQCFLRVITVSAGQEDRKRDSAGIANQMTLAAQLGTVGRIRSGLWPPKTARIEQLSIMTLDQSIREYRASQSRSAKWIKPQIPASCHSRKRLQQVIPEPQPSSLGSISQGMPLRRTNRIPLRQARSDMRGRPPFSLDLAGGKRGAIRFHKSSEISGATMARHLRLAESFSSSSV